MRKRTRVCVPGTGNHGSQLVQCSGKDQQEDSTCSQFPCPNLYCPDGFEYLSGYVDVIIKENKIDLFKLT